MNDKWKYNTILDIDRKSITRFRIQFRWIVFYLLTSVSNIEMLDLFNPCMYQVNKALIVKKQQQFVDICVDM